MTNTRTLKKFSFLAVLFCLLLSTAGYGQKFSLSGNVKDGKTGEPLTGAVVQVKAEKAGVTTNAYGFYSLTLPKGKHTVLYYVLGYEPQEKIVDLNAATTLNVELVPKDLNLDVEIRGKKVDENVKDISMSKVSVDIGTIKKMPALMGEVDVLKSIQLLPGVQNGGEGASGFYVRGGGTDQNLILLDEAPVYNASHLMGFFSVFNSDAVKNVELYKGGIPAAYGGRLSSILDVTMKEGNSKKLAVSGGIGSISSRLTVEGPLAKDKSSFIISGRRTYADAFLALSKNEGLKNSILYFYDLNAKINYNLGKKDRLFLSGYLGRDKFGFSSFFGLGWGNYTGTLRWNHIYGGKLFSNVTLLYSSYDYRFEIKNDAQTFVWTSNMQDAGAKVDYTWYPSPKNTVRFGGTAFHHTYMPGKISPGDKNSYINEVALDKKYALEEALYISNEQKVSPRLSLQYGLRGSFFQNIGPENVYTYTPSHDVKDTTKYGKYQVIKPYTGLEPRVAARIVVDSQSSIKTSYNRTFQYVHLLSNSNAATSTDIWIPSSPSLKPQIADQVALGYFRNFKKNTFEASAEVYYKWLQNQVDFKEFAQLVLNPKVENELRIGSGKAYGAEFFLRKSTGQLTGWISYTLSRTERTVPEINDGKPYFPRFDRRHNGSIVLSYDMNKRWNFSANFVYNTGAAVTMPVGRYSVGGIILPYTEGRNRYRLPDYHRMDVSATLYGKKKPNRKWESNWNFSVYNVYGRYNTYAILFQQSETDPSRTKAVRLSLFYIIPSITFNFKF